MNKYIEYTGTEVEYTDEAKVLLEKSDSLKVYISEKDGYASVRVKFSSKKK